MEDDPLISQGIPMPSVQWPRRPCAFCCSCQNRVPLIYPEILYALFLQPQKGYPLFSEAPICEVRLGLLGLEMPVRHDRRLPVVGLRRAGPLQLCLGEDPYIRV